MSDRIRRTFDFSVTRAESADDAVGGLTLEGYAAVFNQWTEIHGERSGPFMEQIAPGAFKRTIEARTPVLQFDHGSHPLLGSIPIGVPTTIREDDHGLFVRARLSDNWLIQPVRDAIADGAISGMSFRFSVPDGREDSEMRNGMEYRTIREVVLYEMGPVVFPAYEGTAVGVRSELADIISDGTVQRDLARLLAFGQRNEQIIAESDPDLPVTSDEEPDTPPSDEALAGRNQKQRRYLAEKARRSLGIAS